MGRSIGRIAAALILLGTCAWAQRPGQPEGAHIRAALGDAPVRSLGVSRGNIAAWLNLQDGAWLEIQAYEFLDDHTDATLFVSVPNPRVGGRWRLGRSRDGAWARYTVHDITADRVISYGTDPQHAGTVVLRRFDEKNQTIEGTFAFVGAAGPETLIVRAGSF